MNEKDIEAIIQGLIPALRAHVAKEIEPLQVRIRELEAMQPPAPPKNGRDGPTLDEVLAALKPTVDEALAAVPAGAPGRDGPTLDEVLAAIPKPADGTSVSIEDVKEVLAAHTASWALDFERRAQDVLQRAIDRMPAPRDGRDALQVSDFDFTVDEDGRTITVALGAGDNAVSVQRKVPWLLDRGVYSPGKSYDRGDAVSWGGNVWFAQTDGTKAMPAEGESEWRLAVRKGRDGRNGVDRNPEKKPVKLP